MRLAYACEGSSWGPRVRARAVISRLGGTVVATGAPGPPLEGLPYRQVRWADPSALDGFDLVLGDWSCVAMRPPGVYGVAVTIAGQPLHARHGQGRPPDAIWDAETRPLHPWAVEPLPDRRRARSILGPGPRPVLAVLDQSHTPGVLHAVCKAHASGWQVYALDQWGADRLAVGADLLVCPAGWAQVVQAKAARVPYVAVEQHGADHRTRAHCTHAELPTVLANLEPRHARLPGDWAPLLFDHLPAFAAFAGVPYPQPLVDLDSPAWT